MKCEPADDHEPADDRGGDHDDEHGGPWPEGLVETGRKDGAAGRPDEEEVDGADRAGDAAEVVRGDGGEHRPDHGEGAHGQGRDQDTERGPQHGVGHEVLDRARSRPPEG